MTALGWSQIEQLAERYKVADRKPAYIYTSTLKRAILSGQRLATLLRLPETGIRQTSLLDEIDMGLWSGKLRSEVCTNEVLKEMKRLGRDFLGHGGESHTMVTERVKQFLDDCLQLSSGVGEVQPLLIAAITHVTAMRCLLYAIGAVGYIRSQDLAIYNGRTIRVCYHRQSRCWELHGYNITDLSLSF